MKLAFCLCVLVLLPARVALAQDQRAFLDISINRVSAGDHLVVLRGADVLLAVSTLTAAGVHGFGGTRESVGGEAFVSLTSLAPQLTFVFDERELRLALTVDPEWLGRVERDLRQGAPDGIVYRRAPSGFLNYAVTASNRDDYDLFTESAFSAGRALLYNTATTTEQGTVRGLTNVTIDQRAAMRRFVIGDSFAGGEVLGGDALVGGLTVSKDFSLAPYFVRYPTLAMSTTIATPSVVEVYVNGRLVQQENALPGRLDLRNLPLTTGRNDTRIVVRDPFGGAREITTGYYLTNAVLARGIQDYQYSLGWRRDAFGSSSADYGQPALLARHRIGVNDWITMGGRFEADRDVASGGPSMNLRLAVGDVEASVAASRAGAERGTAASFAYVFGGRAQSFGISVQRRSAHYATVSLGPLESRPGTELSVFGGLPLGGGASVTLQHSQAWGNGTPPGRRTSLLGSVQVARSVNLLGSVARTLGTAGVPSTEASVSLMVAFGSRAVASASAVRDQAGARAVVEAQQPLPIGKGYGYQVRGEIGARDAVNGVIEYQGDFGRYEVRREGPIDAEQTTVSASGAIVGIGGGLYATRAIRNSFALVRVPGVADVRAYSSHQEIGRTNSGGNLLVPDLLPYYGNELSIADTDVPIDYLVSDVDLTLAPPYRGGAVALFPVRQVQRITGSVIMVIDGREIVPEFGELAVTPAAGAQRLVSPIGRGGEVYFENLPPGHHQAVVTFNDTSCGFTIDVPASQAPDVPLGRMQCTASR
jgi:outer membrane usher protein